MVSPRPNVLVLFLPTVSSLHLRRGIFTFIQSSLYRTAILSILIQTLFPVPSADGLSPHPSTHIFVSTSLNIGSHVPAGLSESLSAVVMDQLLGFPELDFECAETASTCIPLAFYSCTPWRVHWPFMHAIWTSEPRPVRATKDCIRRSRSCIFGTGGMPSTFPQIALVVIFQSRSHSYDDSLRVSDTSIQLLWAVFLS
ncbi:hypothetical protein EDC04DRAFT_2744730 [Pisolithus marmoratus]|nr:hypothetical protein EDC04DRAFT_2744730 [Pisolithus marmoratus]